MSGSHTLVITGKEPGAVAREQGDLAQAHTLFAQSLTVRRQNNITWGILDTLASWVGLALAEDDAQSAARLAGAVQAEREAASDAFAFDQQELDEQTITAIRTTLGDAAFTEALEMGRQMTLKQAVDYALSDQS